MVLGFQTQFVDTILSGIKIHTIRGDGYNRWKSGNKIHFATGVRTKYYNCFKESVCKNVQKIVIEFWKHHENDIIRIDEKQLTPIQKESLALHDGFKCYGNMHEWFTNVHKDDFFIGKIIHWTDYRY